METTACFSLLLLICSLSTAQLQTESDEEIFPHGKQTESQGIEPANASAQGQTCMQDIHAVLREMNAMLGEQRVEMRHLQRENEAQEAKLREQEAKLDVQKTEVDKLKQQLQAQAAELIAMKSRINVTENQVEALRRDGEVKQVAFSTSLLASGEGTLGPYNAFTPLVYKHVFTNIGNAYNPNTGLFTAPVRGAYHFEFYIGAYGHSSHASAAVLVKNGVQLVSAYTMQPSNFGTSANGATLLLEVGDIVFMRLWINSRIFDNDNNHSTFSGHLIFTM